MRLSDGDLERLLAEDAPYGDLTTHVLGIGALPGRVTFSARYDMVAACVEEAARMFELAGAAAHLRTESGRTVTAGTVLLEAEGTAASLHIAWKTAQTLVEAASGIAGRTQAIVAAARAVNPKLVVACTRKTFPGTKAIAIKAIIAGGAMPHRLGLSESILIFPEHRLFKPAKSLAAMIAQAQEAAPEKKVVIEVVSIEQAVEAAKAGADVVQTEKFTPDQVATLRDSLAALDFVPLLAVGGGVTSANAADYARAGADILVTSAPYAAPPSDVKVTFTIP